MTKLTQDKETLREAVARAILNHKSLLQQDTEWAVQDEETRQWYLGLSDAAIATMFERLRTPGSHAIFLGVEQWCQEVDFPERDVENIWQAMLTAFQQENSDV